MFKVFVDLALQFTLPQEINLALQLKQEAVLALDFAAQFIVLFFESVEPFFYGLKEPCHLPRLIPEFGEVNDGQWLA